MNLAIKSINKFISHAFKIKGRFRCFYLDKEKYDVAAILNAGKPLGIVFSKSQIIDINFLRSRDFLSFCKEKILRYLYTEINKSNGDIKPDDSKVISPFHMNRFYIGRGNNYMIVRSVIKQRWWWAMNDREDFYEVNFLWTQWRKNKHLCILDTKTPVVDKAMLDLKKQVEDEHNNEAYSDTDSDQVVTTPKENLPQKERDDYFKNKVSFCGCSHKF